MLPIGSSSRRLLNQSTHPSVANSTASMVRHDPRRWMTSAFLTHSCNVCGVQPIFDEIETTAAQREACSPSCSRTIRTARARTSGENLFVVLLVMAPSSQELEPPANPGRFTYNMEDVLDAERLLAVIAPLIDVPVALYRGRYGIAVAAMEATGLPYSRFHVNGLVDNWDG